MEPEEIVKMAEKLGADEAEVFWIKDVSTELTVEKNEVDFGGGGASTGYSVRVLKDGRIGFSYFSEKDVESAVEKAIKLSKLGKKIEGYSFLKEGDYPVMEGLYHDDVANYSPEEALRDLKEMVKSATDYRKGIIVPEGGVEYGYTEYYVYNSHGLYVEGKESAIGAGLYAILDDKGVSNGSSSGVSHKADLDFSAIGKEASEIAVNTNGASKLEKSGKMDVLFMRNAIKQILEFTTVVQLYGNRAHRGESPYKPDMLDSEVAAKGLSVYDDQTNPQGLYSAPSDDEGGVSRKLPLIENGVLKNFMFDSVSAKEFGAESTGNGMRSGPRFRTPRDSSVPETVSRNMVIEFPKVKSIDELISEMDRGIAVYSVLGAHTSNAVSGDMSMNSTGLLYVEGGEIKHPVSSAMLGGNSTELLKNIIAIGDDRRPMSASMGGFSFIIPSILVSGMNVA